MMTNMESKMDKMVTDGLVRKDEYGEFFFELRVNGQIKRWGEFSTFSSAVEMRDRMLEKFQGQIA